MSHDDDHIPNPKSRRSLASIKDAGGAPDGPNVFESDSMKRSDALTSLINNVLPSSGWTPGMAIGFIFIGSFIAAVLFTAAVLAGIIEIQPAAIKGFFKSILGKH